MDPLKKPVYVTQPSLPPLSEMTSYLEDIWDRKQVTNNGKYHKELEEALCTYLGVEYISLFSNGTLALITALQALKVTGEVITTPFSFVATTHSLWWNNIEPVFCDIENSHYNLSAEKIEAHITPRTSAILPVHVFGNPCEVDEIQSLADAYGLKVIYDAAHAFGVKHKDQSVLQYGDLSILSFHATKVFNTFEGGAIISRDRATKQRIDYLKNFGFADETTVITPGINAKMNEFQAALGLLQLKYVDSQLAKRRRIAKIYESRIVNIPGISKIEYVPNSTRNYSYFPVLVDENIYGHARDEVYAFLKKNNVFSRRYFYPLISNFPVYAGLASANKILLPNANEVAEKILCLPIYSEIQIEVVEYICDVLSEYGMNVI
jgi:dTDP-4-amino-4,6-dideoxygalactose transaminase